MLATSAGVVRATSISLLSFAEKLMRCRVCFESELEPLWVGRIDPIHGCWHRCLCCGSDTSNTEYDTIRAKYNSDYMTHNMHDLGGMDVCIKALEANVQWFQDHRRGCPDFSFLDIGCAEGAALRGMAALGWAVHGFDIDESARSLSPPGQHITVAPAFAASLFPQRFSAVLCREVIEHVPDWRMLLSECWQVMRPNGIFQLQTPRPWTEFHQIPYQVFHLQLFAPAVLRYELERRGFEVIDHRLWPMGQGWVCRRI